MDCFSMRSAAATVAASLLWVCGAAIAAGPAAPKLTLLDRTHAPEAITLLSITSGESGKPGKVTYLDAAGAEQTRALNEVIALAPPSWVPTPDTVQPVADEFGTSDLSVHRLDLTTGERFVGELSDPPARGSQPVSKMPADAVYLKHERLGMLAFPLDRVARYWTNARRTVAAGARPLSGSSDTVLLANAERLEGLVTRIGPEISIEIAQPGVKAGAGQTGGDKAGQTGATQIDIGNVALVSLVNPATAAHTLRIDLADGTTLAVDSLAGDAQSGKVAFKAAAAQSRLITLDLGQLAGVVPDPSKIVSLASLPIASQAPAAGRVGAAPAQALADVGAPLSAADVLLPGPMTVEWAIPAGASTVQGYAQMDDRSFAWGDCTVVVSVVPAGGGAERELARGRLNATSPSLAIAESLGAVKPGDRLRVRTESGERGPIQDRVVLRRMVLIGGPGAS